MTNPATSQPQNQGYELALSSVYPIYELLEQKKGTNPQIQKQQYLCNIEQQDTQEEPSESLLLVA